jgi:hypothetical protein
MGRSQKIFLGQGVVWPKTGWPLLYTQDVGGSNPSPPTIPRSREAEWEKCVMARNFRCEFRNEFCDDPRCKKGYCVPEAELNAQFNNQDAPPASYLTTEQEVRREARAIAKSILKEKGIKPTKEIIAKLIAMPQIRELAHKQVRAFNDLISGPKRPAP